MSNFKSIEIVQKDSEIQDEIRRSMYKIEDELIGDSNTPVDEIVDNLKNEPDVISEGFNEEELKRMSLITLATAGRCAESSAMLAREIKNKFGDECTVQLLYTNNNLKYFFDHTVAVIHYKDKYILASPANPVNLMHLEFPRKADGKIFWRHKDMIIDDTLEGAIEQLQAVEGGTDWEIRDIDEKDNLQNVAA